MSLGVVVALAVTGLFFTVVSAGVLTSSQTVPSTGSISTVGVGVFNDAGCTVIATTIAWGNIAPSGSVSRTVYVKNTGNVPVTLSMAVSGWVPANGGTYLTVVWNRVGYVLAAGASVDAALTLSASASAGAITSFSVNIVITGTG